MPHLSIEYSANLQNQTGMQVLCVALQRAMLESGLFEMGAVRVRAYPCDAYAIADRHPGNAFADLRLRIGQGRSVLERQSLGRALMAVAEVHFAVELARPHFALSLEIVEIDGKFSWKTNTIHPRLRGAAKT